MSFSPRYLYIKQHSITGMLYFGQTSKDPIKYSGSGLYWLKHINKHGHKHVVTLWYELFTDRDEIIKFATQFSKDLNIVKSNSWANLIPEDGLNGGAIGHTTSESTKEIIRQRMLGREFSIDTLAKMRESAKRRKHTVESKIKMSNPQPIVQCPHCIKRGGERQMKRYHFTNCRLLTLSLEC